MTTIRKLQLFLPLVMLLVASLACGSTNTGTKVGENEPSDNTTSIAGTTEIKSTSTPTKSVFTVGDIVSVNNHTIEINSVDYSLNLVKLNFSIKNTGSSEITISSLLSFSAKSDDGTKLESEIFDCGTSLDGKVLPGDSLRGDICYLLPSPGLFKVYYESNLFSSGAVVWQFDTNNLPPAVEPQTSDIPISINSSNIGEVIKVKDHTIILNSAVITNNLLKANITIENLGTEDLHISSLMSFSAKTNDGTKLDIEIFDCGTSLDGTVLPNDKLRGDVCYKTGGATPIKLYYESNFLSSGTVVWIIE